MIIYFSAQDDTGSLSSDSEDLDLAGDPSVDVGLEEEEGAEDDEEQFGSDDNF